jgi:hypothetical protein
MNIRLTTIAIAIASLAATATTANAWSVFGRWQGNSATMRASSVSFPVGSPYRTAVQNVVNRFHGNPSNFWINQVWGDTSVGFNNGQSELWFSSSSSYSPAVTFTWFSWSGYIKEADVVFYNGVSYTPYMTKTSLWPYGGSYRPFETTLAHEYGHVAGLGHENRWYNIMGEDYTHLLCNGQTARSYLGGDACGGLIYAYGVYSGNLRDVSVALHRYSYPDGEYSRHKKGQMSYGISSLVALPSDTSNGQRRYSVYKGQLVRVGLTYENQGYASVNVKIGYYISTDSNITTADRLIGVGSITIPRGVQAENDNAWLYIPSDLASGSTYYLGAIVDYNKSLSEVDESNNAAYHIIRVN